MADLLFELLCEELPPRALRGAATSMEAALDAGLRDAGLPASSTRALWTPRRIALFAHGLSERTPDREERVKGPRVAAAFDASGAPTKAAEGFARKCGVDARELDRDGEFVWAVVRTPGRAARDVVAEVLPALLAKAGWKKAMRWGVAQTFARPIRGVVALLGEEVVDCEIAGLRSGRTTRGHPFLAAGPVEIERADLALYEERLHAARVIVDPERRREAVLAAARRASPEADVADANLVEEVTNLVEWPAALLGVFDERYLQLPPRLLVTVMAHHQRFLPVRSGDGALRARFVAILDRDEDSVESSRRGFERVLVPRLHDASFFFAEDRKRPLADRADRLATVTYHKKLGTLREKAERLSELCRELAPKLGADPGKAAMAGLLAKCDLVTLLVGEFPELQGYVGMVYALADGEDPAVAHALDWQYRHEFEFECGARPGPEGLTLLLAENLDVLCQFGTRVGLPSGSTDPFGVRRAAITMLEVCERWAPRFDLHDGVRRAGGDGAVLSYLDTRLRQRFRDRATRADFVEAVHGWFSVHDFAHRIRVLEALAAESDFDRVLEVAERCRNITKKAGAEPGRVEAALLVEPAERDLWTAWTRVRDTLPRDALLDEAHARRIASTLAAPLHRFFEEVFVNAEDAALRRNRLSLLTEIDRALLRLGDLCKVVRAG